MYRTELENVPSSSTPRMAPSIDSDQPLTPAGRLFLRPEMNHVIHCAVGLKDPIDVDSFKTEVENSLMLQLPMFTSLMVRDANGVEHWRKTQINIDRHFVNVDLPQAAGDDHESVVNGYLAELSIDASTLSTDKPLWEIHILRTQKCVIFRIHHALGDGISLMSLLLACCRKVGDPDSLPTIGSGKNKAGGRKSLWNWRILWGLLTSLWFSLLFILQFISRSLFARDRKTAILGGSGVELWPRKLATARFSFHDMKVVKNAVPNATINDVLFGILSFGFSRYLDHRSPNGLPDGLQLTGLAMVNLRQQSGLQDLSKLMRNNPGSQWGNHFGMLLLPITYHKSGMSDPLQYLRRAKVMVDRKKNSLEGLFSYKIGYFVLNYLGPKFASILNYRILCNTTFTISNVVGPQEEIMIAGNPVTYLRANSSSLPHASTMHMVSYAGRADMQILVAKDIIPDPDFLAKCFEDALLEMKEATVT